MNSIKQIIGMKCKLQGNKANYSFLLVDHKENRISELKLKVGSKIQLKLLEKGCIGYWDMMNWKYEKCGKKLKFGTQCDECKIKDFRNICLSCNGIKCNLPKNLAEIFQERKSIVYLAQFGSIKKVGTSRAGRFLERLLEQGADSGKIIKWNLSCLEAKRLEKNLSKKYKELVLPEEKIKNLFEAKPFFPIALSQFYPLEFEKIEIRKIRYLPPIKNIYGRLVGVKGPLIFIQKSNEICWMNFKELRGFHCSFRIENL